MHHRRNLRHSILRQPLSVLFSPLLPYLENKIHKRHFENKLGVLYVFVLFSYLTTTYRKNLQPAIFANTIYPRRCLLKNTVRSCKFHIFTQLWFYNSEDNKWYLYSYWLLYIDKGVTSKISGSYAHHNNGG